MSKDGGGNSKADSRVIRTGNRQKISTTFSQRKDHRISSQAIMNASMRQQMDQGKPGSHISIENMPQAHAGRNQHNELTSSVQMLSGSDSIESRKRMMMVSEKSEVKQPLAIDRSFHLRYVS